MLLILFFALPIATLVISGALNVSPGDPFPTSFDEKSGPSFWFKSKNVKNITSFIHSSSTFKANAIVISLRANKSFIVQTTELSADQNKTNNLSSSTTIKPVQEIFPIYTKHLIRIVQSKYTVPKTNQTRYWYHTIDSPMGVDWTLDSILCQAYIRQKPYTIPVHAFHTETKDMWTNTLQIESKPFPIGSNQWKYDGIPFYAYQTSMNTSLLKPVWRYWNRINYGIKDVGEPRRSYLRMSDTADDNLPGWRLDRILFYAFSPDMNVTQLEKSK